MMTVRWIKAAVVAAGLATVTIPALSGCQATVTKPMGDLAKLDFTLTDMDGKSISLADFKGRPILVNFWATWCPPCKQEIPAFIELQDRYRSEGFVVLGVSTDDPADALRQFAAEYKMNYPVLQASEEFMDAYGPIWAIPVSVFIKRDGTIYKKHMGPATKEDFEKDVKALL